MCRIRLRSREVMGSNANADGRDAAAAGAKAESQWTFFKIRNVALLATCWCLGMAAVFIQISTTTPAATKVPRPDQ